MPFHPLTTRSHWQSPLGLILLSASPVGLSGVFFEDQRHLPDVQAWPEDQNNPFMRAAIALLKDYFSGPAHALDAPLSLPLDLQCGSAFQQAVWQALLRIPAGQTQSYGQLAQQVQRPTAVRAVGAAVGRNPISLIVPCHRIVGAAGQLTGYAGGLWRKEALLTIEHALPGAFATPGTRNDTLSLFD
jgi:methylated-DNA-[protein]-cysteine S-methyltransferase